MTMLREPQFCCAACGRRFSESRASDYKCDGCAARDQAMKLRQVERGLERDDAGLKRMLGSARGR
jgi:hypothetical protein